MENEEDHPRYHRHLFNPDNMPPITRLIRYLADLQEDGRAVFFQYSGHVDWIEIKVCVSPDRYEEELFSGGHPTLALFRPHEVAEVEEMVDNIISQIDVAVGAQELKESELRQLAELKAKYEPEAMPEVPEEPEAIQKFVILHTNVGDDWCYVCSNEKASYRVQCYKSDHEIHSVCSMCVDLGHNYA